MDSNQKILRRWENLETDHMHGSKGVGERSGRIGASFSDYKEEYGEKNSLLIVPFAVIFRR